MIITAQSVLQDWLNDNKPKADREEVPIKADTQILFRVIGLGALSIYNGLEAVASAIRALPQATSGVEGDGK